MPTRKTYDFTVVLAGHDALTPSISDRLFAAGINGDDTLVGSSAGSVYVDFERTADSLGAAIGSAVTAVERAGFRVARVVVESAAG
jgi:hypothetical protein